MPTKLTAILGAFLLAPLVVGCTPTFSVFDSEKPAKEQTAWQGPTAKILVNHLTCELVNEYKTGISNTTDPDEAALWKKLADDHFVAAVDLNLVLTQIEGLNPGYSGITPLNALGQGIPIQTQSGNPPITTFASGANNLTLAIGAQLSGTQDNTIDLTYVVDMSRIAEEAEAEQTNSATKTPPTHLSGMPDCNGQGNDKFHHGLRGSLDLGTNIDEVLTAIDASGGVNVYGSTGPFAPADISEPPAVHRPFMATQNLASSLSAATSKVGSASAGGGTAQAVGSSTTGFSFKIDFTVLAGLSGGPSWTLLQAKYPVGGGSSSSGQLLNYSHQTVDTLTMTFAPTCSTPADLEAKIFQQDDLSALDFSIKEPIAILVHSGIDANSLAAVDSSGVLEASALGSGGLILAQNATDTTIIGAIGWTGSATIDTKGPSTKSVSVTLTGTVTNRSTRSSLGTIAVQAIIVAHKNGTTWSAGDASIKSIKVSRPGNDALQNIDLKSLRQDDSNPLNFSVSSFVLLLVRSGIDPNALAAINVSGVLGATSLGSGGLVFGWDASDSASIGTMSWSGYATVARDSDANTKTVDAIISGTLIKNSTQRPIGRIVFRAIIRAQKDPKSGTWSTIPVTATPNPVSVKYVKVNNGEMNTLLSSKRLASFWDTIPPCDTLTGPAIQNIWDNAAAQAQLFKLTSGLTGR